MDQKWNDHEDRGREAESEAEAGATGKKNKATDNRQKALAMEKQVHSPAWTPAMTAYSPLFAGIHRERLSQRSMSPREYPTTRVARKVSAKATDAMT